MKNSHLRTTLLAVLVLAVAVFSPGCKKKKPKSADSSLDAGTVEMNKTTDVDRSKDGFTPSNRDIVEDELPGSLEEINRRGYLKDVYFDYDQADLQPEARDTLSANATWLKGHSAIRLKIEGHCDERGTREYNLALGERRAASVRNYLTALGIDDGRMQIVSYGEERPFATANDESAWSQNRRGHFVVTGK